MPSQALGVRYILLGLSFVLNGLFLRTAFPAIIDGVWYYLFIVGNVLLRQSADFGGPSSNRGNTGPFWIGSGLAVLSALITFFFIRPLSREGLAEEDRLFREYLEAHGYDTSRMGFVDPEDEWSQASLPEKEDVK